LVHPIKKQIFLEFQRRPRNSNFNSKRTMISLAQSAEYFLAQLTSSLLIGV